MNENRIAEKVLDAAFRIHRELGPGLLESVYESVLAHELNRLGVTARRQVRVPITFGSQTFDEGFRADLVVADRVIVELKSVEKIEPVHAKQLLTYLRLTGCRLGLLINFNTALLKNGVRRIVNGLDDAQADQTMSRNDATAQRFRDTNPDPDRDVAS